jgi:hypothetical protein
MNLGTSWRKVMFLKRLTAIMLCGILIISVLAGCSDPEDENGSYQYNNGDAPPNTGPEGNSGQSHGFDFDEAFAAFAPDTIMIKADDFTITWDQLFVFLFASVRSLEQSFGMGASWTDNVMDNMTYADLALDYSTDGALMFLLFEYGAKVTGVTLSAEDIEDVDTHIRTLVERYGGEDEFLEVLRDESGFHSLELFRNLLQVEYLHGLIASALFGENGDLFPDEDVAGFVEQEGFMKALHILRMKTGADDDTSLEESEDILRQLNAYDGDDFEGFFAALMFEHSEDTGGLMSFPHGYLFEHRDMVVEFSDACAALKPGQFSDIVETLYGYHIILRLPVDYDEIPYSLAASGQFHTLRQLAAFDNYELVMQRWRDELVVDYTPEYLTIDLATIFPWHWGEPAPG